MNNERFTIRIAICLVLLKENQVLMGRRHNTSYHNGDYAFPSGHLEADETIVEAIIREAHEETGIILQPEDVDLVHVVHRMEPDSTYIDFYFVAKKWQNDPTIQEPDKCDSMEWFAVADLPQNILPYAAPVLACIQSKQIYSEFYEAEVK